MLNRASTSIQLISASTQLSATPSISHVIEQCPQIYSKKFKFACFDRKLARMISSKCWFRIWNFWNSNHKISFWANLGQKTQSCPFCLKIGIHGTLRMVILVPTLAVWISNPKSVFGKIWVGKLRTVCFAWKLAHMVSWSCWFRVRC